MSEAARRGPQSSVLDKPFPRRGNGDYSSDNNQTQKNQTEV